MLMVLVGWANGEEPGEETLPPIIRQLRQPKIKSFPVAPDFAGITEWIQSEPLSMKGLRRKVVILHFWTNGCINCQRNYEHYRQWLKDFDKKKVVIVGVHTPELESEKNIERIREQATKHGLDFPIAVDNAQETWRAWDNRVWPTVYVIDQRGRVRYVWVGELAWEGAKGPEIVRDFVQQLLDHP
jgi:peroxiredoxin